MSILNAPIGPRNERIQDVIRISVPDVLQTATGLEFTLLEKRPEFLSLLSSLMVFSGHPAGGLILTVSETLARRLVEFLTGMDSGVLSEQDLKDGIAELLNMIAGRIKALLGDTPFHFHLGLPHSLFSEEDLPDVLEGLPNASFFFECEGEGLVIRFFLQPVSEQ